MISSTTLRLVRDATALRIVRIDFAVRPCLPITRPRSSFATRNSRIEAVSPWVSLTSTASGLLTNCCARNSTSSLMAGSPKGSGGLCGAGRLLNQLPHGVARFSSRLQPLLSLSGFQCYFRRIERGVVSSNLIDVTAVAGRPRIGNDDTVEGPFLGAMPAQSDNQSHSDSIYS